MHRVLPVSRQVVSNSSKQGVRIIRRRLATEASPAAKKPKSIIRRIFWTTTTSIATFYVGSTFASFYSQTYHDFFSDHIPLGQSMLEYGENRGWDSLTISDVVEGGTSLVTTTYHFISDTINGTSRPSEPTKSVKASTESKSDAPKPVTFKVIKQTITKAEPGDKPSIREDTKPVPHKAETTVKDVMNKVQEEYSDLVQRAEAAISGKPYTPVQEVTPTNSTAETLESAPEVPISESQKNVYNVPLPLGFEPPPGFSRPSLKPIAPKPKAETKLPLVAPDLVSVSEPIITHLAGTIDDLATYLKSDPKAAEQATGVLETAKSDLAALVERIEVVKEQERSALEAKMDEQSREYTLKLMELEMEGQDKLDHQEQEFRTFFDQERARFIQAYRDKLDHELTVQTELINERLKEEVIAQGIELQRRWIREIKVRVEQERGGRLAKLDELSANLKRIERIALDNSSYLDENIRVHALWGAIRAFATNAISSNVRKPFREELRVLRHIAAAREDPVVSVVLESLEGTGVPDIGVEPFADLATWFVSEVSPKVSQVALVPDQNAGVLSYLASRALSSLRFKRHGLVPGDDVLSVLARAEYHLNEKDLDSAARELNQLKGPAKDLLHDWLEAARRRLEVQQALEVIQTQATLASLLVV